MSLLFAAPFINMQAWLGGARWLCAYAVVVALSMLAVAVAILIVGALFASSARGARDRSRRSSAAVIGAAFAIGLQFGADRLVRHDGRSPIRRAGDAGARRRQPHFMAGPRRFRRAGGARFFIGLGVVALAAVIGVFAPRLAGSRWPPARVAWRHEKSRKEHASAARPPRRRYAGRSGRCWFAIPG